MASRQAGRSAPWAKALGAVLLAFFTVLIVAYAVGESREADRERSALEATRADAQRFADAVVDGNGGPPHDRRDAERALDSAVGKGQGLLYATRSTEGRTRTVLQFSRTFERSLTLLGPAQATVDRCFTVVFHGSAARTEAEIVAHDADETCSEAAR
ncbi:hypothetical protein [Streptomyces sp. AS02]|uniref:hypothetical protein n=1 Tax=Streptomyces sp. AS02 TaxID=2938946 RepID=UPI00201FCC00|nr:hypothetical protein [Streptomyces sp. AS02]MCL8017773.1 hypothetical protein [Streptomyces sp. AS02]